MIADEPQPIDTAPQDGTVILTDSGVVRALSKNERSYWYTRRAEDEPAWVLCYPSGTEITDSDHGPEYCNPELWTPLPGWMR